MSKKNPKADRAKELYLRGMKLVDIAALLDVPDSTVRRWKSTHKWGTPERSGQGERSGDETDVKTFREEKAKEAAEQVSQVLGNPGLNDQQRLFCLHYVKCFNATRAYMKAYPGCSHESATARSCALMKDERVREEIFRLKQAKMNKAMLEPEDVFQKYMEIAFCDMADYVSFGREKVQVMSKEGPVFTVNEETGEPEPLTKEVNSVRFRESDEVDGSLISEISQGKDGAKIKLADRMKALDWLAAHMDMGTEEQKARVEKLKAETSRIKGEGLDEGRQDDGFLDALKGEAADLWEDE